MAARGAALLSVRRDPADAMKPEAALDLALVAASPLVLAGLRAGLTGRGGFEVVLEAHALEQARELGYGGARVVIADGLLPDDADADADAGPPHVVLADPAMPGSAIIAALLAGVSVLPQRTPIDAIGAAAVAAANGLVSSAPALWAEALRDAGRSVAGEPPEPLTPREQQVLVHMSEGLANREIARVLQISPHTAKYHVSQIIAKLQAGSRAHAVAKALRAGWVDA